MLEYLEADKEGGLSSDAVREALAHHQPNCLTPARRRGSLHRFLAQFHNVLICLLVATSGGTAALGHWVDTGGIRGVVVINAIIGFVQEGQAERALDAL